MGPRTATGGDPTTFGARRGWCVAAALLAVAVAVLGNFGAIAPSPLATHLPTAAGSPGRERAELGTALRSAPRSLADVGNGSGWVNLTEEVGGALPPTSSGAMAYDPNASADILIPGTNSTGCTFAYSNGVWRCYHTWYSPPLDPALAWSNGTDELVAFGGEDPSSHHAENSTESYVLSDGGWSSLSFPTSPSARWAAGLAWDASDGYLVLFGGTNGTALDNDTWALNATGWTRLHPNDAPSPRSGAVLVGDPALDAVVLFGGVGAGGVLLNDTWVFQDGDWQELATPVAPAPRSGAFAAYDAPTRSIVVFGGVNVSGMSLGDTWYFTNDSWIGPSALTSPTPSGRAFGEMAPSPSGNGLLLFGGISGSEWLNDTWLFYTITTGILAQPPNGEGLYVVNFTAETLGGVAPLTFDWTFGDGTADYGPYVTHLYDSPGRYTVNLTITDAYAVQGRATVAVADVVLLFFEAAISPSLGFAPAHVEGTSSASYGAPPYAITWRFTDGPTLSGTTAAFTYLDPGTYPIAVWCNDSFGHSFERTFTVEVLASPPAQSMNVTLLANRTSAAAPATIGFVAGASGAGAVLGFTWTFGDGTGSVGANVSHVYGSPGRFLATVKALGADGAAGTASQTIVIVAPFSISVNDSVTSDQAGALVYLNASGSGGFPPYRFYWQFPNGTGAVGANVTGFSAQAGTLAAQLQAIDALGDVARYAVNVSVPGPKGGGPPPSQPAGEPWAGPVELVALAAALGLVGGIVVAVVATRHRGPARVTRARSGPPRPGPRSEARPRPPTASGPTGPRSPPGRNGDGRRRPPPSG